MSQNPTTPNRKKFNFTKWGFILAIVGTVATVATVPEIRGLIAPKSETGVVQKQEVELITQTEQGETLPGVKVRVISHGAPEVKSTDDNGYAKVQIPSKGDVVVNLSKAGYPTQNFTINLENEQSTTRVINLSKSGEPDVKSGASAAPTSSISNQPQTTAAPSVAANKTNNSYSVDDANKNLETLNRTKKCSNCYLVGVTLGYKNLERADLEGANLRGARAGCNLNLKGANLRGADLRGFSVGCGLYLQGADLRGANLKGAYLGTAKLRGADLTGVDLSNVNLAGADLAGAIMPNETQSPQ
ncbi:pentapeptide repeat-containing protein [Mastigocladopsis repens]|uniref:pentapeptide repeat-containing protein n=1 Tax=Mastigocladopsis repens TaxID=221287 RepID=UPI0003161EE3|nr:pentapeptide repeat-containing protein [Mastigocladopsis repens]